MNVRIIFPDNTDGQYSSAIQSLATLIEEECQAEALENTAPPLIGAKDAGLTIGLTVAGLALSAISTLIATLTYWEQNEISGKVTYSASLDLAGRQVTIASTSLEVLEQELEKLESSPKDIVIQIAKG